MNAMLMEKNLKMKKNTQSILRIIILMTIPFIAIIVKKDSILKWQLKIIANIKSIKFIILYCY